jgi:probable F420-dependent oxidoreductase
MELGAVLPHHEIGTDPGAIRAYLEGVEELGMTHLLVYDHVLGAARDRDGGFDGAYDSDVAFHEPMTFLAFAAALTRRLELVTTVLVLPQRQTALVAKQAAEVAVLSGDRLRLGVGTGWNQVEYQALNEDFTTRGRRQAEQVELMRRLWSEPTLTFDGRYHTVDRAGINPRPSKPVPIWFGGSAPVALERCARLGDGWMPLGGPGDEALAMLDVIRRHREAAGRSMDGFGIQAQAQFAGGTPERWRSHADRWAALGATHLAVATHRAGDTDVDGHLARVAADRDAVTDR